jgi:hypothetical protein
LKIGIDILSQVLDQVPSAQVGLTSLFGMGRGDPHRYRRHKGITYFSFEAKTVNCNKVTYLKKDTSIELKRKILDAHNRKLTGN